LRFFYQRLFSVKFVDTAQIKVKAGDGGLAMAHFRREKYIPFGGPDGGNGGRGGNVFLEGHEGMGTLLDFRYNRIHEAENGGKGGTNNRQGGMGEDLILQVPCGTIAIDSDTGLPIGEVLYHGHKLLVANGGRGGLGNHLFASSRNQAPTKIIPPDPGETKNLKLELKVIADIAIIGAPNAGKSTLISVISAATPKVADYPFTTLVPNLGVVSHKDAQPFVVADVPGLIVGASEGKGLGFDFLRHVERAPILVHLVDGSQGDFESMKLEYEGILNELQKYKPELLDRPRITVISKCELVQAEQNTEEENLVLQACEQLEKYFEANQIKFFKISSAARIGLSELLDEVLILISRHAEQQKETQLNEKIIISGASHGE
jgi:GTPase